MASRPCKPDADLKRIWRSLLPDTPFPVCGTSADATNSERNPEPPAKRPNDSAGDTI